MRKARKRRARMSRSLGWEGADPRTSGNFYKTVVQETLRFGAESWVMYPRIRRTLGGFHHRVDHWMGKMQPNRTREVRRIYPPLGEAMKTVGLKEVETYVLRHQNTVSQYIYTWPILELCLEEEIRKGARV